MFSQVCLTLLLVIASGNLRFSQAVADPTTTTTTPTTVPTTTKVTTTTTPAPTTGNTTTPAPTTGNTTTPAPTTGNTTTPAPTTGNTTTPAPTTGNTTTPAPTTTNATTPAPTTTPPPKPTTGNYTLQQNGSDTACFMARMGLQISFKQDTDIRSMNLEPGSTNVTGSCSVNGSDSFLTLHSEAITMSFAFTNATNRFHLRALNVTVLYVGGNFSDGNSSLSLWEASVGSSYMCKKEQSDEITSSLTLHTFDLQIQPFAVENNKFSTVEDCQADEESYIVPIAVGAALAALILIVLVAYFIGRRRSQTQGYESF